MSLNGIPWSLATSAELEAALRGKLDPNTIVSKITNSTLACYYASIGCVNNLEVLHRYGADFRTRNGDGRNPLQEAEYKYRKTGSQQFRACAVFLSLLELPEKVIPLSGSGGVPIFSEEQCNQSWSDSD